MKKILLSIFAITMLFGLTNAQTSFGLKAGVNLSNVSKVENALEDFKKNLTTFYVTGFADISLAPNFSIQPGLSLQGKGTKLEGEVDEDYGKITVNLMDLEVPVNFLYYIPAGSGQVFLGAGPYLGIHLSGKTEADINGEKESTDLTFSGDDRDFNRLEGGINFLSGYKFGNGLLLNLGYGLGLSNIVANQDFNSSHRIISFGLGYQF